MIKTEQFPPPRDYQQNALKDLLDARDHYHVHLSHLPHVVGTAVGKYLIRKDDWWANHNPRLDDAKNRKPANYKPPTYERTLFNSVVRPWSWPCVLVFVRQWMKKGDFSESPDAMVPRTLFLPDGRVAPTCVVLVQEETQPSTPDYHLSFPRTVMGGGLLALTETQGLTHLGSIACLVTDGDLTYALTNRHVTGEPGRVVKTVQHDTRRQIGVSAPTQVTKRPFVEMYPGWSGSNVQLHVDAGLIRIDDLSGWTAQVAKVGALDEPLDLTTDTLSLELIDQDVCAFGAASGKLDGRIAALFYRYATVGGVDYVTDFLIRPEDPSRGGTAPGDSGTLWFWKQSFEQGEGKKGERLRPFAMQWGGHTWVEDGGGRLRLGRFALATSLSVVCRELGVSLVRDWNTTSPETWGAVGHYTIGRFACDGLPGGLGTLMKANQEVVSYPQDSLTSPSKISAKASGGLVPLADVPDRLWAHGKTLRGAADKPNHFADMDTKDPKQGNKTLLELCQNKANVNPDFWLTYYSNVKDSGRGLLPFRVWQFFDEMKDAASRKDVTRFVCAAGISAHYVGDACQPLHCSHLHHGKPDGKSTEVHAAYEDKMLAKHAPELLTKLTAELKKGKKGPPAPKNGREAAVATVDLMRRTFASIPPEGLVDAFIRQDDLWDAYGSQTVSVMADGVRTLQSIWLGAWNAGHGTAIAASKLIEAPHADLIALYMRKTWMPSMVLKTIGSVLKP